MSKKESASYQDIGLKVGIEIHQQLETHKLFCKCPSIIRDDEPDIVVKRYLRASAGETGEIDTAAKHEQRKEKEYIYQGYSDTTCLVEFDAEPPHEMNQEALSIVLQVARMLKAKVVDEIQVMRKIVVDGSNTSGFQRTALVARNGWVEVKGKKILIPTICVEEESAKIVERKEERDVYNLSRLGIPLIEIATAPQISSPQEAKEVAAHLGMILRSTGRIKRGLGTIRQDLNISIRGGARIEIKGAQDLKLIPKLVEHEVQRQKALMDVKARLLKAKDKIANKKYDITQLLKNCGSKIIQNTVRNGGVVLAVKLPGFKGLLGKELQPGRRLGTEFADYVKVVAGLGGIFHSDELPKYGITEEDVKKISNALSCKDDKDDAFVFVAGERARAESALEAVIGRARMCFYGVPEEVRKANLDGTTSYLRPIPGAARMYPETDVRPIVPKLDKVGRVELLTDKIERYQKQYGINKDFATLIVKNNIPFEEYVKRYKNIKPLFIAETLLATPKELKKRYQVEINIFDFADELFGRLNKKEIPRSAVIEILAELGKGKSIDYSKYKAVSDDELEAELRKIVEGNKDAPFSALMGIAMSRFRGKADGKRVAEILKKLTRLNITKKQRS